MEQRTLHVKDKHRSEAVLNVIKPKLMGPFGSVMLFVIQLNVEGNYCDPARSAQFREYWFKLQLRKAVCTHPWVDPDDTASLFTEQADLFAHEVRRASLKMAAPTAVEVFDVDDLVYRKMPAPTAVEVFVMRRD